MDLLILALAVLFGACAAVCGFIGLALYHNDNTPPHRLTVCCGTGCTSLAVAVLIPCVYTRTEAVGYVIPLCFLAVGLIAFVMARREYLNGLPEQEPPKVLK